MTDEPQLQSFLDHVAGGRGGTVTSLRPISGGYSRISTLATVRWADGSEESFVLRSDPPPQVGVFDSDRDTEWRLLEAISGKLPIHTPTPRWYDATGQHLGAKCAVDEQAPAAESVRAALTALAGAPRQSLHLDDVVETYCRAGNVLSAAIETAVAADLAALVRRGEEILDVRSAHETEVMAGWSPTGR